MLTGYNNTTRESLIRAKSANQTLSELRFAGEKLILSKTDILQALSWQMSGIEEKLVMSQVESALNNANFVFETLEKNSEAILNAGVSEEQYTETINIKEPYIDSLTTTGDMATVDAQMAIMTLNDTFEQFDLLQKKILDMIDVAQKKNLRTFDGLTQNLSTSFNNVIFVICAFVAILIFVGFVISSAISKPIQSLTSTMAELASGMLEVDISNTHRKDEVGNMAKAVLVFKEGLIQSKELEEQQKEQQKADSARAQKLSDIVKNFEGVVTGIVASFSESSQSMQEAAKSLSSSVHTSENTTEEVNLASGQAMSSVETVAAAVQEMSASIQEISSQINSTMKIIANTVDLSSNASEETEKLAAAADQIGDVVTLIRDIAEQTNLLALNATIESARAGEAGKGFAVVASEVKELASQTSQATEQIAQTISEVQLMSTSVTKAIDDIRNSIQEVNTYSTSVASAIEEQSAVTNDISANMQLTSKGVSDISGNMSEVVTAVADVKNVAASIQVTSDDLNKHANTLNSEISSFCESINKC